jgi:hypothetical protein
MDLSWKISIVEYEYVNNAQAGARSGLQRELAAP